jgi:prepilin-type N-terminal cleavage/methylation domain-containing protein
MFAKYNVDKPVTSAFSLVELSIVLVILGLLVGGVLSGQALIKAAQLRSIATEHDRWIAAAHSFRDKYFYLPGDLNNATSFWGKNNAVCPGNPGTASTTGTCNGNGNGAVAWCSNPGLGDITCPEVFGFWQQLALAGMIEGAYTGTGSLSVTRSTPGTNTPTARYPKLNWIITNRTITTGDVRWFTMEYGNVLIATSTTDSDLGDYAIISPEDAWNIDTKMDDGKPSTGKLIGNSTAPLGCAWNLAFAGCTPYAQLCSTATGSSDYVATYIVQNTGQLCYLQFPKAF